MISGRSVGIIYDSWVFQWLTWKKREEDKNTKI